MPASSLITRVREYASETGQDTRDVYVRLLALISMRDPEVLDAAFAEMRTHGAP